MRRKRWRACCCLIAAIVAGSIATVSAQNQTPGVSPVYYGRELPYRVTVEQAGFVLPSGLHSFASATFGGRWLMLAGRINGLHGFENDDNNFPPNQQNTTVFVVDPTVGAVYTRSLTGAGAGLTQAQIDVLSVTSGQSYQIGNTLYMTGGYGVDTAGATFSTKDVLTAIDVPGLMQWVVAQGKLTTDPELPFINQITTVRHGADGTVTQFLMDAEYPVIASTGSNPGNRLLFGAGARFFPVAGLPAYPNGVIALDQLGSQSRLVGYVGGGIMSTLPNTNTQSDSAASPYVFRVTVSPQPMEEPIPVLSTVGLALVVLLVAAASMTAIRRRRVTALRKPGTPR